MTDGPARRELAGVLHRDHDAATTKRLMLAWQAEILRDTVSVLETESCPHAGFTCPHVEFVREYAAISAAVAESNTTPVRTAAH